MKAKQIAPLVALLLGTSFGQTETRPAAPSNLTTTAVSSSQINLSWKDNSNNETGFTIDRTKHPAVAWYFLANVGHTTSYANGGLSASTTYYYRVQAHNSAGSSAWSNTASATTRPAPTPTPATQRFGFPYPNFTGATGAMTAQQFVQVFDGAMHNPNVYRQWINSGTDIRKLNPAGVYLKHLSIRTLDLSFASVGDHPDYNYVHTYHPEWILHDANGNTVPLFASTEESLDFGNPAYLEWVFGTWFPNHYFDSTDRAVALTYYLQDNGDFLRQNINCAVNDTVCQKYTTDAGVQSAFKRMFDKFHQYYPNKRIFVSTGPKSYMTPAEQLPWMEDVLSHADGYFSECLTNEPYYWNTQSNADKRNALQATLQLADWLVANGKYFFPNLGMGDGQQPTQAQTNYGWAFFNLLRRGDRQFFSKVTQDSTGLWQPRTYPEMQLALGQPLEERQQISPNVYRRTFEQAIAYVNLSDSAVSIKLPAGTFKNSLGQVVISPLTLASFSGLTVYGP